MAWSSEGTSFEQFFATAEPRLRRALVATYGGERGREASAEALAWAWEHWPKVQAMEHPLGYLYRVAQSRSRPRKVTVLFVIDGNGKVADALVQQTTMASEPVESCILNHVRRWQFPSPQGGGTVQVTYPYVFKSAAQ